VPLNSLVFLLGFLPVVVIAAHLLRDRWSVRAAQLWILGASVVFYAWDGPRNLPLLFGSIVFNWAVARAMASSRFGPARRKQLLVFGLTADILFLCVFKYTGPLVVWLGHVSGHDWPPPHVGFPLGVSFFVLTQVMYLVDCYERLVPPNTLVDHATFISFFPNITAGPLVRAKHFIGQLGEICSPRNRDDRLARGIALLSMGLFKKVVLGDSFVRVADAGYANVAALSTLGTWLTSLAYTFHMYFDFSGYSDMAFGVALLLGITLVRNFNAPFRAVTISDFWQRWHMSLSGFIQTYLFTPLVRSMGRVTVHTAALATFVAMTVVGLWHGAAWRFVLFYVLHGAGLAAYQYWKRRKRPLPRPLAAVVTFAFVNLAFIVFRAPDAAVAATLARRLLPIGDVFGISVLRQGISVAELNIIALPLLVGSIAAFVGPTSNEIAERFRPSRRAAVLIGIMVLVSFGFMGSSGGSAFIYRAF
jgi:D-alanyl-lipoteichoic acid acyltransferase DltB (MBOAT superfamily)